MDEITFLQKYSLIDKILYLSVPIIVNRNFIRHDFARMSVAGFSPSPQKSAAFPFQPRK